jgi:hypothetical protein
VMQLNVRTPATEVNVACSPQLAFKKTEKRQPSGPYEYFSLKYS